VAAGATQGLAGLDVRGTAHGLHGAALGVERLEEQRHAAGHAKVSRAVRFDGHGAQHGFAGIVAREAEHRLVHPRLGFRGNRHDAKRLHVAALH
jgi:hypothetical protein